MSLMYIRRAITRALSGCWIFRFEWSSFKFSIVLPSCGAVLTMIPSLKFVRKEVVTFAPFSYITRALAITNVTSGRLVADGALLVVSLKRKYLIPLSL